MLHHCYNDYAMVSVRAAMCLQHQSRVWRTCSELVTQNHDTDLSIRAITTITNDYPSNASSFKYVKLNVGGTLHYIYHLCYHYINQPNAHTIITTLAVLYLYSQHRVCLPVDSFNQNDYLFPGSARSRLSIDDGIT